MDPRRRGAEPGGARIEEMARVDCAQVIVALRVECHLGQDADPKAELDVGLDHVRVERREHDVGREAAVFEGLLHQRAVGEGEVVGDDRELRQGLEGERSHLEQGVLGRHHHAAVPLIDRQRHELGIQRDGFRRDAKIGVAGEHLLADLGRVALVDPQLDARIFLLELGHGFGQRIARLGMGGGDGEGAELLVGELLAGAAQVVRLGEDALGDGDDRLARLGDGDEALAVAHEDVDPELLLQRPDLLRHPGLGRVQRVGGLRDVEAATGDFREISQLLQLHRAETVI